MSERGEKFIFELLIQFSNLNGYIFIITFLRIFSNRLLDI